jgi:hypothetical protein
MGKKALITTVVSVFVFALIYFALQYGWHWVVEDIK